jgi:hypothetical protein
MGKGVVLIMEQEMVEVNGKKISTEEFQLLKEQLEKAKDVKLIEIAPNCYKTKLFG